MRNTGSRKRYPNRAGRGNPSAAVAVETFVGGVIRGPSGWFRAPSRSFARALGIPLLASTVTAFVLVAPAPASAQDGSTDAPCTEGVISSIALNRRAVFDPQSTGVGLLSWTYRTLNVLHVRTSESFIRRELLFEEGDCYDPFYVSESERLLDAYGFLSQATISTEDDGNGGKQVLVTTRDEWSTKVDLGVTYDDGPNFERFELTEENFLGQGIFAEYTYQERRESKSQEFGITTPRLFGRADASVSAGTSRPGHFVDQYVRYPFIGEAGSFAVRQGFHRGTDFFAYSADGAAAYTQLLVPVHRQVMELSGARRIGERGRSFIAGLSLTHEIYRFPRVPQVAYGTDFDALEPWTDPVPAEVERQMVETGATRIGLHFGTRRLRYEEFVGLDGVRDRQIVGLGLFAGVSLGKGFSAFLPLDLEGASDTWGRAHASFGAPLGASLLHGGFTAEARHDEGHWRDVLLDADLVAYLRTSRSASHTFFLRMSTAAGWQTTLPYQLSLGGRDAVRSLVEDRFPGGRMLRFVIEDRIVLPWPPPGEEADLGLTLFSDIGRMWPGDAPFGTDSGWQAGVGVGLRIGWPAGTRNIWRTDLIFPVRNSDNRPVFRVTFELNRLRAGFFTQDVLRSRRFNIGPDQF